MPLTVQAVPESLTRSQFVDWLAQIGLDPTQVRSLKAHPEAIEAEVYAPNGQGERFTVSSEVAVDRIHIPIID